MNTNLLVQGTRCWAVRNGRRRRIWYRLAPVRGRLVFLFCDRIVGWWQTLAAAPQQAASCSREAARSCVEASYGN